MKEAKPKTVELRVKLVPKLAYCAGCDREFYNIDGCNVCRTSEFIQRRHRGPCA